MQTLELVQGEEPFFTSANMRVGQNRKIWWLHKNLLCKATLSVKIVIYILLQRGCNNNKEYANIYCIHARNKKLH